MESEDSDTAMSEEEAVEDACGQVDKENQKPNDRPVSDYVDIEPQPNKHTKPCDSPDLPGRAACLTSVQPHSINLSLCRDGPLGETPAQECREVF
ncbi:hypothetical protein KUCAC02_001642, partial [Chaenocephalus aceratus]